MTPKILMAEFNPWAYSIQTGGHKYARFFLQSGWSVFWLSTFLNFNRIIRRREDDQALIKGWQHGPVQPEANLITYTPFSLLPFINAPGLNSRFVAAHALKFTYPSLTTVLTASAFSRPDVLWLGIPRAYSILKLIKPRLLIYRMADNMAAFPHEPALSTQLEADICRRADLIFATAYNLVEKARQWSDQVHYLPNGVDFDFFACLDLAVPADLSAIPGPRILYVGAIDSWFDFETVAAAASQLRSYAFVLIGPVAGGPAVKQKLSALGQLPNVYILGSRPFEQVRHYMRHAQVGLIPFVPNPLTHSISPIKLFEYMAAGLSVVATRLEEIERLVSPALLYDNVGEFLEQLQTAVGEYQARQEEGRQFAAKNSWQVRFETIEMLIRQKLNGVGQAP